jgi:hypothetical protein
MIPDIIKNASIKKIRFNETSYFHLIPSRQEILDENLKKDLWWTQEEMNNIRYIYTMELQQFMQAYPHNNIRDVQKQLWLVFDFDELYARFPGRINN